MAGRSLIHLTFGGITSVHDVKVGPAQAFRVAGNFIHALPGAEVVASYSRHQWHIGERHFSRYDCSQPVYVYFQAADGTRTPTLGPFEKLVVADGTMYADEELFAKFIDETLNWHSYVLETYWPTLIIVSASNP